MPRLHHWLAVAAAAFFAFPALASPPPAAAWGPWVSLGRPEASALSTGVPVTTMPWGEGRFIVFGAGQDGQVYGRTSRGAEWGPWHSAGRPAAAPLSTAAPPAAVSGSGDRFTLYAIGQDGLLYRRVYSGAQSSGWSASIQPSGVPLSPAAPVKVRVSGGVVSLFVLGQNGALYMRSLAAGDWGPWVELGRPRATPLAPAARITTLSRGRGHLAVFVAGQDGRLYIRSRTRHWRPWGSIDPPAGSAISPTAPILATSAAPNRMTLWAITQDGQLHQRKWTGGAWAPWRTAGRPAEAPLSTGARVITVPGGPLHYDVLAIGQDGRLYTRGWTSGTWGPWAAIGNPPASPLGAGVTVAPGRFALFAVGQDGVLYSLSP